MSIFDEIKESYKKGTELNKLIYINIALFLLLHIGVIFLVLINKIDRGESISKILYYLAIPADPEALLRRPWTVVTYMFSHGGLSHIVWNMLIIYWFGRYFVEEFGRKKVIGIYLLGGFAGALFFVLFYNIFPYFEDVRHDSIAVGASASVMALVFATVTAAPQRRMTLMFIGPVKIIYLAVIIFTVSTILDFTDNTGGKIAHMGGALLGFLYARSFSRGKDITAGFDRFMDRVVTLFKPRKHKMKVTHKRPVDDFEYNKQKVSEQKQIDEILDKISKAGYDSLTAKEKEMLFNMRKK